MQTDAATAGKTCDLVGSLVRSYEHLGARHADRCGLHVTDFRALLLLTRRERAGQTTTAGTLASELYLSSGAVTYLLERLGGAGLVQRCHDPSDRRRVVVTSTPKGRQYVRGHEKTVVATVEEALASLGDACRADVEQVARRLHVAFEEHAATA